MKGDGAMKLKNIGHFFLGGLAIASLSATNLTQPTTAQETRMPVRFTCASYQGSPATVVSHNTRSDSRTVIVWNTTDFGPEYSPQVRCDIVSERFDTINQNGDLRYVVEGRLNGYPVLCASPNAPSNQPIGCSEDNLLMTLRRTDNPQSVLEQLATSNTKTGDATPLMHNGTMLESPNRQLKGINVQLWISNSPSN